MVTGGHGSGSENTDPVEVLHVDEDPAFAESVGASLEGTDEGFVSTVEPDPEAALARVLEDPPDAVVSGYRMAGMDGLELLRAVRATYPDLPFVLFTGNGSEDVAAEAVSAGVTGYLRKGPGATRYEELARRLRDAVDRYRSERDTEWRDRLFGTLYDDPLVFVCVLDPDGTVRHVNESVVAVSDSPAERFEGERFWELPWFDDAPEVEQQVGRAAAGETVQFVTPYVDDGGERTALLLLVPVDGNGEADWILALGQDVTWWTRERDRVERQNERLEAFTGIVSHDLRNPLAVVGGNLELARREHDSDVLRGAQRAVDRMDRLVDDLLVLAREGETIDAVGPVDLGPLAERTWADLETADASLVVRDSPTLLADEARLAQVLENLFTNAVTHGGDAVTVTVGSYESGFFVEDDGPGIDPDRRQAVFEAGYSTASDGTGFGLRIVRDLVEAHGWTVRATAGRDGGARFEITVDESD